MEIAIIGSGAIGGLIGAYLKQKGQNVFFIGRAESIKVIEEKGLAVSGVRGNLQVNLPIGARLDREPDLAILATKTQDLEAVFQDNLNFLKGSLILTTQNGVQADEVAARFVPRENIISSIVMFGSTYLEPGKIVHNFEGSWIIGKMLEDKDQRIIQVKEILNKIFPTLVVAEIKGMKYLKIFVNANNCLAAILGKSMQETFADLEISKISIAIWKEGLNLMREARINLVSLPDFPLERIEKLVRLPAQEAAKIFSGMMTNLSKEPLYGSILQSIKRGRTSEIDYINGEFVRIAKETRLKAALNEKLVEMVHQVEKTKKFFNKPDLISQTQELLLAV